MGCFVGETLRQMIILYSTQGYLIVCPSWWTLIDTVKTFGLLPHWRWIMVWFHCYELVEAEWRMCVSVPLVQIMAYSLVGTKPLSKPMLDGILLIAPIGIQLSEIFICNLYIFIQEMHLKMMAIFLGLNVLNMVIDRSFISSSANVLRTIMFRHVCFHTFVMSILERDIYMTITVGLDSVIGSISFSSSLSRDSISTNPQHPVLIWVHFVADQEDIAAKKVRGWRYNANFLCAIILSYFLNYQMAA